MNGSDSLFNYGSRLKRMWMGDYSDLDAILSVQQEEEVLTTSAINGYPGLATETSMLDSQESFQEPPAENPPHGRAEVLLSPAAGTVGANEVFLLNGHQYRSSQRLSRPPSSLHFHSPSSTSHQTYRSAAFSSKRGEAISLETALQISQYDFSRLSQRFGRNRLSKHERERKEKAVARRKDAIRKDNVRFVPYLFLRCRAEPWCRNQKS
jgi:hypothetical protein